MSVKLYLERPRDADTKELTVGDLRRFLTNLDEVTSHGTPSTAGLATPIIGLAVEDLPVAARVTWGGKLKRLEVEVPGGTPP